MKTLHGPGIKLPMLFRLVPNQGLFPIVIGMSYAQLKTALGASGVERSRRSATQDVWFEDCNARVTIKGDHVAEVSVTPPSAVLFEGRSLFGDPDCWKALVARDPQPMEAVGFVILKSMGVAFTGLHDGDQSQAAVTMFEAGHWDALTPMIPFRPESA